MSNEPTRDQIEDLKANLAYHEHQAALIRERLASVPATNRVPEKDACPGCGERDADRLVWIGDDGDLVRCRSCEHAYRPNPAR
ncbi:MAG: hypothetical protein HND58_09635 [Planctomycetota bacterium]|nr:MAG: hypothetical protein HND58_09635 [Planctomycetota bacterium]